MADEFSAELELFMAQHIESLAQLETLLLMWGDPARQWDCAELSRALYITPDMCSGLVADLQRRGFLGQAADSRYQYQPANPEMHRLLTQLAAVYQERRVAVITQIYSRPMQKVKTFADSFRLRREGT
jgi:hypothetical protein